MSAVIQGVVSALIFFGAYVVFDWGIVAAALAGGGVFVAMTVIQARRSNAAAGPAVVGSVSAPTRVLNVDLSGLDITPEQFHAALDAGSRKMTAMAAFLPKISDHAVRAKVQAIVDLVARILTDIRDDPKDLRPARRFLDYYLDSTIKVVEKYVTLKGKAVQSAEVVEALRRTEASLDTIRAAYQKQLEQLQENDVLSLDTELRVLEQTIKMEGLGEEPR